MVGDLIKLGRGKEVQIDMQAVLTLKPKFTAGMALDIFRYLPDCDDFVGALRQAGLLRHHGCADFQAEIRRSASASSAGVRCFIASALSFAASLRRPGSRTLSSAKDSQT
jgi:hypothetical protein